ncbi:hypothetical protein VNO78_12579 [Psophocarpus tetragonolobus]|uniref:Uncharacterized protein n=1 Tax=Psophocarpus tetragonolobus TaxID=3891 RepID=A0AAN9XPD8_PSOTE
MAGKLGKGRNRKGSHNAIGIAASEPAVHSDVPVKDNLEVASESAKADELKLWLWGWCESRGNSDMTHESTMVIQTTKLNTPSTKLDSMATKMAKHVNLPEFTSDDPLGCLTKVKTFFSILNTHKMSVLILTFDASVDVGSRLRCKHQCWFRALM